MNIQTYIEENPKEELDQIFLTDKLKNTIHSILDEYKFKDIFNKYNLPVNNKVLLHGDTGCGKTMTVKAIAKKLDKKLVSINLGTIVSSKLGETSKNLSALFQKAKRDRAILFIDEFDSLGKKRELENENGEMHRIVNTLLQLIDYLPNSVFLFTATNQIDLIDKAILRRFNHKLQYKNPTKDALDIFYTSKILKYPKEFSNLNRKYNISYAEAENEIITQVKNNIINQYKDEN